MEFRTLQTITTNFLQELQVSEAGKTTSLACIKHTLAATPLVTDSEVFQVLTIGGSVFKKALLKKQHDQLIILSNEEKLQSPFPTEQSLLEFVARELDLTVKTVAINFAYPLAPLFENGKLDGMLIMGSKENTFMGLVGKKLCQTIETYIAKEKNQTIVASCANDTICLLLSGLVEKSPSEIAAGIVGTGMNFAMFSDYTTAINLEAANFDKFDQSNEGKLIDQESAAPQSAVFEKEISGAYLYRHYNLRAKAHNFAPISSSIELDNLARQASPEGKLATIVLTYSAELVACTISAITLFKQKPLTFVMEGSLFWKGYQYKEIVAKTVAELIPEFPVTYISIADSYFLGPAKLVS
ncbi:hypothetical protein BH11PAT1_BH11PAT1_2610 [soil metagenome]